MNRYPVFLKRNLQFSPGWVWCDPKDGLWHAALDPAVTNLTYTAGPFGTRFDAELEVIDVYERAAYGGY